MKRPRRREIRAKIRRQRVPTEQDWGDYKSDLDRNSAHQMFAGKTNDDMQAQFRRNPVAMTGELRWMPQVPFQYYMIGFRDLMQAGQFDETWKPDAASCFLGLIIEKLKNQPNHILAIMPELLPTIEFVANNQAKFGADESIYGNFLEKSKDIHTLYARHGGP
jgi:hypothetical protein